MRGFMGAAMALATHLSHHSFRHQLSQYPRQHQCRDSCILVFSLHTPLGYSRTKLRRYLFDAVIKGDARHLPRSWWTKAEKRKLNAAKDRLSLFVGKRDESSDLIIATSFKDFQWAQQFKDMLSPRLTSNGFYSDLIKEKWHNAV